MYLFFIHVGLTCMCEDAKDSVNNFWSTQLNSKILETEICKIILALDHNTLIVVKTTLHKFTLEGRHRSIFFPFRTEIRPWQLIVVVRLKVTSLAGVCYSPFLF